MEPLRGDSTNLATVKTGSRISLGGLFRGAGKIKGGISQRVFDEIV